MAKTKVNYKIGDIFMLPLDENGNYGVGRILLAKSPVLFVEFYKKVIRKSFDISFIQKEPPFYIQECGDLGFKLSEWKVIGNIPLEKEYDPLSHYWWIKILDKFYLRMYKTFDRKNLYLDDFEDVLSSEEEIKRLEAQRAGAAGYEFAQGYLALALQKEGLYEQIQNGEADSKNSVPVESSLYKKKKNKDFPFTADENIVNVNLEDKEIFEKYYPLFEKYNIEGNGYAWEGMIKQILEKMKPELIEHLEFDSEGSSFCVYSDSEKVQKEFVKTIAPIFSDIQKFENWLKEIDKKKLDN
ncbi:MAG TPA: Imm51 family immunity protein [bacterium]|nr:Imm51 family immunity protein [bacterium]